MRRKYITAEEYAKRLDPPISHMRVCKLASQGRIEGAKPPHGWLIPEDAPDPRMKSGRPRVSDPVRRRGYHEQDQAAQVNDKPMHENDQKNGNHGNVHGISPLDAIKQKYLRN